MDRVRCKIHKAVDQEATLFHRPEVQCPLNSTNSIHMRLSCCRMTARRSMSVEILSTAAQLYEKTHLKRLAIGE